MLTKCINSNTEDITPLVEFYQKLLPEPATVVAEFGVWKEKWIKEDQFQDHTTRWMHSFHATASFHLFSQYTKLLQIFTTPPVTTLYSYR